MRFRYVPKENREQIPRTTGVYSFWTVSSIQRKPEVLYIGKAANLRDRVKNHFLQPNYRDNFFIHQMRRIGYIETRSEIEALLLESQLIKKMAPKYNVMWKDAKGYFFVGVTQEDFPRVLLTHQPGREARNMKHGTYAPRYIGPFTDGKAIKRTLRSLRRVFPYYTSKKHGAKLCPYCHLGLCPGPAPDKSEYKKNIKNLISLLQGKKPAVLKKLEREMKLSSQKQEYEKAGKLRDQLRDLEIVFSHAKVLRPPETEIPTHWRETEAYLKKMLGANQRISRVEAYDISNIHGKEATGSMPVFLNGKPAKQHYRKFKIRVAGRANDFAMLKEVVTRRLAHSEWAYPDLMVVDGGKGQLSAALEALRSKSRIAKIHVAAIAKRNNELFLPGKSKPLLLKDMPRSVSNFILHIRDEAHRFAIAYHRFLRRKTLTP